MARKQKAVAEADDSQLAEAVRASAQQIWQAGLGAFAKAQEEGGKAFAKLVQEGSLLQKRTQKLADGKFDLGGTVAKMAESVSKQASGSWDKLEQVFEDRVSRSLKNLGVPTHDDIEALNERVEELSEAVAALSGKKRAAPKAAGKPAAKKAGAKTAAKKSVKATVKTTAKKAAVKDTPRKKAAR